MNASYSAQRSLEVALILVSLGLIGWGVLLWWFDARAARQEPDSFDVREYAGVRLVELDDLTTEEASRIMALMCDRVCEEHSRHCDMGVAWHPCAHACALCPGWLPRPTFAPYHPSLDKKASDWFNGG